jgi:Na+/proline symporter
LQKLLESSNFKIIKTISRSSTFEGILWSINLRLVMNFFPHFLTHFSDQRDKTLSKKLKIITFVKIIFLPLTSLVYIFLCLMINFPRIVSNKALDNATCSIGYIFVCEPNSKLN